MNYSILRVILNDFSTEGLINDIKKISEFRKLYISEIKPILYENYKKGNKNKPEFVQKYNFDAYFNDYIYPNAEKAFKQELRKNPNIDIKKYVNGIKKEIIGIKPKNYFFTKNKQLLTKLCEKFVQANNEAINKCKTEFDDAVNKLRNKRNSVINANKTNKQIMDWLIENKTVKDYLNTIEGQINSHNSEEEGDVYYITASIVDSQDIGENFDINNGFVREWNDTFPLIDIIYNCWVNIAERYAKQVLGNRLVDIDDVEGHFLMMKFK